jgi:hypothetical protein
MTATNEPIQRVVPRAETPAASHAPRVAADAKSLRGDFVQDRHQSGTNTGLRRRVTGVVDDDES